MYIAVGPTLIGNVLWAYGTGRLGATRAGAFLYLSGDLQELRFAAVMAA
jgi:drug/metabolite transporter (DMT)-like permease